MTDCKYFYSAQDNKIIDKWVQSISSGGMCINDTIMQVAVENLPFGGVGKFNNDLTTILTRSEYFDGTTRGSKTFLGHSGMGAYHGNKSFECFSHYKSVLQSGTPQFLLKTRSAPYGADVKNAKTW